MVFKKGHIPWCKGKKHSEKSKKKMSLIKLGIKFSKEHKKKIGDALRGMKHPWTHGLPKDYKITAETRRKISLANKGKFVGEKSSLWKGDKIEYSTLHIWVQRWKGKANHCEHCGLDKIPKGKKRFFEWANKSHKYKRDLTDWIQLCCLCHGKYDRKFK